MKKPVEQLPFDIDNPAMWQEIVKANGDPIQSPVISFIISWAKLMEKEIVSGRKVSDVAEETQLRADNVDFLSLAMVYAAETLLLQVWRYREDLRQYLEQREKEKRRRARLLASQM